MTLSNSRQGMTRDQVLVAHAAEMIARTSFSQDRFAQALAAQLHELVPEKAEEGNVPDFALLAFAGNAGPFLKAGAAWLKRVQRWLAGEVDLPAWIEEAWVQALDDQYRERCINELAARYGLVGARAQGGQACPVSAFGQLVARLGGAVEAAGAVLADQKIDEADLPLLPDAIERLLAVESRACEIRRQMENELAQHGQPAPLRVVG